MDDRKEVVITALETNDEGSGGGREEEAKLSSRARTHRGIVILIVRASNLTGLMPGMLAEWMDFSTPLVCWCDEINGEGDETKEERSARTRVFFETRL